MLGGVSYVRYEFVDPHQQLYFMPAPPQPMWLVPQRAQLAWVVPVEPQPPQLTWIEHQTLSLSRALARTFGYSGENTLSTEMGYAIGRRLGVPMETAKSWFHGGLAGFAGLSIRWFGAPFVRAFGLAVSFFRWLESFDSSK